jgi:hypothetical protein
MGTRADNKIFREYRRLVNLQIGGLDWRYKRSQKAPRPLPTRP